MKRLAVLLATMACLLMPVSTAAAAYNPLDEACATKGANNTLTNSAGCSKTNDPIVGPHGILHKVTLIIATIAGAAAVIMMIIAGFQYITAAGDPQQAASARNSIIGAAVGLIVIVAAEALVVFVLNRIK